MAASFQATLALAWAATAAAAEGPAAAPPPEPAARGPDLGAELAVGLSRAEERLASLEARLGRIEALLRTIYGERIRRAEALSADAELASAVAAVEERYGLAGAGEALTADGTAALVEFVKRLAQAASARGPSVFAADRDVQRLLAGIARRSEFLSEHGQTLVWSVSCGDERALETLVEALLSTGQDSAREAALWAAPRLERGGQWGARLAALARSNRSDSPRLRALALAAAAAHGDAESSRALAELVRERAVPGAFALRLAGELRAAGSPVAFRVYLELLRDEQYTFAAAQAFSRIEGFDRRIGWREAREEREKLYDEFRAWLDQNDRRLRFDATRGRFLSGDVGPGK